MFKLLSNDALMSIIEKINVLDKKYIIQTKIYYSIIILIQQINNLHEGCEI